MSIKKYKCVKSWPGGLPLNTIAIEQTNGYTTSGYGRFDKKDIESYPEFWEEIKEPEFQILAAKTSVRVSLTAENTSTEIYKVLRFSDNVIFSVGDKCNLKNGNGNRNPILRFEVRNESFGLEKYRNKDRIVVFLETMHKTEWGPIELDSLVKSKEPLFTTKDGVEIFNGDNYWFVVKSDLEILKAWTPRLHICDWDYSDEYKKPPLGHVQFSTEKAANEWVEMNKPMYSKKQILEGAKKLCWVNDCALSLIKLMNLNK